MDTVDPDTGSGERQGLESSFARSLQGIMGLLNINNNIDMCLLLIGQKSKM